MKTRPLFVLFAALWLTGCASNISTPSGRPEVSYEAPPEAVAAALTSEMIRRGYLLTDETPRVLTFQKAGGLGTEVMWGDGATVEARFNLIDQDGLTRVLADAVMIDGRNRRLKLTGRNHTEMQAMLEGLELR